MRQKGNVHLRLHGTQDLVAQSMSLPIALYLRVYGLHLGALSLSFRLPNDTLLLDPWAY